MTTTVSAPTTSGSQRPGTRGQRPSPRQWVCLIALVGGVLRLWLAATTFGTNDVGLWLRYVDGVRDVGPWHVYDIDYQPLPYNHGPLASWWLVVVGQLGDAGVSMPFVLRLLPSLADVATTLIVFRLVAPVRGERSALAAAVVFAAAPVAITIAGFHGNNDPVFVMLVLFSALLLRAGRRPGLAGVAIGVAISVKIVPVVVVPALLFLAVRRGPQALARFVGGGAAVFVALWVPVLAVARAGFLDHVVAYRGIPTRDWGLSQAAQWWGLSEEGVRAVGDHLGLWVAIIAALSPVVVSRYRRLDELTVVSLPLCVLLLLSPAAGVQYFAWAAAPALVMLPLRAAAPYVWSSSVYLLLVYSGWCDAPPWRWDVAWAQPMPLAVQPVMALVWVSLAYACWTALRAKPSTRATQSLDHAPGGQS